MLIVAAFGLPIRSHAEKVQVAVAANFATVVEKLEPGFESLTGHELVLISASTGKLFAQIVRGAPFDVLLAADEVRPQRLIRAGLARTESQRTYAMGRLVLWSRDPSLIDSDGRATLRWGKFRRLALANPDLAPYGVAAREALDSLGLSEALKDRWVMGENIGQTFALVATGNAELGFIAASQKQSAQEGMEGSFWLVPESLHAPIRQDVVLLTAGEGNPAARAFLEYLDSDEARAFIRGSGYSVE
jgi:molybdate transport system substrate-binding protein